jgi:hypothetical protein
MQRWLSIFLGLAAFGLAVAVVVRTMSDHPTMPHADARADAAVVATTDAGKAKDAGVTPAASASAASPDLAVIDAGADPSAAAGVVAHFPDGRPVPPLPDGSPTQVRLGIILMAFEGAQNAPPRARSKKDALELATKLASDAKTDFHAAVVRGDNGSSDDIGRVPRGVLEPVVEYTLFTSPVGTITEPMETPRGYWIAKRTE